MDLQGLKLKNLGIDKNRFGKIYSFVDFGNVNYWYERDERNSEGNMLQEGKKLAVDVEKLASFLHLFSEHKRFYFGLNPQLPKSIRIVAKARDYFDKTVTKPIQKIRHYLEKEELQTNTRLINQDLRGSYVYIPKCNFDVEICVDTVRFLNHFDTFCLFSSDADFTYLLEFLKRKKKKVILFSSGYVSHWLKDKADVNVNGQQIKSSITFQIEKPRL